MTEFIILSLLFWTPFLIVFLKNILCDLYFWQLKEFRWDRFWNHLRWDQTENHKNITLIGLKFVTFSAITLLFTSPIVSFLGVLIAYIIWIFETYEFLKSVLLNKAIRPSLKNLRNLTIVFSAFTILGVVIFYLTSVFAAFTVASSTTGIYPGESIVEFETFQGFIPSVYVYLALAALIGIFLDIASTLITTILVLLTSPIAKIKRQRIIAKSLLKLNSLKQKPLIIAITGSQGKTTTKEILYHIINDKFKVSKTQENYNTDVGVAISIIANVTKETEVFIAEMGMYRVGEIEKITRLFPPDISIVTDVDTQHIGIVGGHENLATAKSEIIKGLRHGGVSILNADNDIAKGFSRFSTGKTIFTTTSSKEANKLRNGKDPIQKEVLSASGIEINQDTLRFQLEYQGEKHPVVIKQMPEHLVNNLLLCIACAIELGMEIKQIVHKLSVMSLKLPRLSIDTGDNNTKIINDSYNSSKKGFIAAAKYLNQQAGNNKKIIITKGIFELGKEKSKIYVQIIKEIHNCFDVLITTDSLLYKEALKENSKAKIIKVKTSEEMLFAARQEGVQRSFILIEGRVSPIIMKSLVSDYH